MDVCVIDIIQTSMYRRPWPVRTHWPATCDVSLFGLQCALRRIHTMRRRFGDRSVGGSPSSVPSPSQLDWARTRDRVGSAFQVLFRVLNYPGLGSKFGSREPGYPLTSLLVIAFLALRHRRHCSAYTSLLACLIRPTHLYSPVIGRKNTTNVKH